MSVAVSMALVAMVVSVPLATSAIATVPAVAWRWWRRCVVVTGRVGVHWRALGYLVYRRPLVVLRSLVNLWPLGSLGVVATRWLMRDTASNRGTCRTTSTGTHYRTVASTHGLSYSCARCATNGTADHRAPLATPLGTDCCTCCTTDGPANHCTLASTHMLAQHRARRSTYATTQQGADIVGIDRCAQGRQRQCAAGKQSCHAHMAAERQDGSF